ncbi:unnamed protein product [Prorocentrum cordatum]|uniref:Guanylate-binding protein N-terminal domain-containing protein n=1 Tax=Prorocentrum cordatum TaxID=2364126 RepID=A0ABN9R5S4_9DINO|nr:unnamed protein product [Polarella glacialis]
MSVDSPDLVEPTGRPVQLVAARRRLGSWHFEVGEDATRLFESYKDCQVMVCTVCGSHQSGKSYLVGILAGRLPGPEATARGGARLADAAAARSGDGGGLWVTPARERDSGQELLLVDCEGLRGPASDMDRDAKLVAMCLLLSSVILVNVKHVVSEAILRELGLVCQLASHLAHLAGGQGAMEALSKPALMLVLRDFALDLRDADGSSLQPDEYLERLLQPQQRSAESPQRSQMGLEVRSQIMEGFPHRGCAALVRPAVEEEALQRLPQVELAGLRPEFRAGVRRAQGALLGLARAAGPKAVNGHVVSGDILVRMLTAVVEQLNAGGAMDVQGAWESCARKACADLAARLSDQGARALQAVADNPQALPMPDGVLQDGLRRIRADLRAEFDADALGDAEAKEEAWAEVAAVLDGHERELLALNSRAAEESLRPAMADWEAWLRDGHVAEDPRGSALSRLIARGLPYDSLTRYAQQALGMVRSAAPAEPPPAAPAAPAAPATRDPSPRAPSPREPPPEAAEDPSAEEAPPAPAVRRGLTTAADLDGAPAKPLPRCPALRLAAGALRSAWPPACWRSQAPAPAADEAREPPTADDEAEREPPPEAEPRRAPGPEPEGPWQPEPGTWQLVAEDEDRPLAIAFATFPPGAAEVDSVEPGSWAERAGLKPGDQVVAANRERLAAMDSGRFSAHLVVRPLLLDVRSPASSAAPAPAGSAAAASDAAPGAGASDVAPGAASGEPLTVTFQPGRLGLQYDRQTGVIGDVRENSQAHRCGVRRGWYISRIDWFPSEGLVTEMLEERMQGNRPYTVSFHQDGVMISMVFPDLNFQRLRASQAAYLSFHRALADVASRLGGLKATQAAPSFCQNPTGSGILARVCLFPHGLGYETLIAKLKKEPVSAEIAQAVAQEVPVADLFLDSDRGGVDTLFVQDVVAACGDAERPNEFRLGYAQAQLPMPPLPPPAHAPPGARPT